MPQTHRLVTLGSPALWRTTPGDPELLFGPSKPLALVTYLAFAVGRRASRDRLVDLLWSDTDPEQARRTLRQTVWLIRQRLGNDALAGERDELSLGIDLASDRDEFLAALSAGELEQALHLYTGPFFASFAAPGAVEFEHWADLERHRLRANHRQALESLARRCLAAARFRDAREYAATLRDDDPAREASWRLLLECLLAAGDSWAAGIEAASLERMLADGGRKPEPATVRLLAATRESHPAPARVEGRSLGAELIGREAEFSAILAAWDQVKGRPGRHVRVVAPAGLGKTRLLRDVHNRLAAGGARVVMARAQPAEHQIAYGFAAQLALGVGELPGSVGVSPQAAAALVALAPQISSRLKASADPAAGDEALRRRTLALEELLAAVSDEQPVALLLDDVHWADPTSAIILEALLHRIAETHVLAVTAERPGSGRSPIEDGGVALSLRPLDAAGCEAVMTGSGGLPDEPWARTIGTRLARSTGGSPLLLLETLRLCLDNGWLTLDASWRCPDPNALESALASGSALRRRIESLEPADRSLLTLIACAGTPVSEARLCLAATRPAEEVAARLQRLEHGGFVGHSGSARGWEVSHDEIAAAALALAGPDAQRDAHRQLGTALLADRDLERAEYPLAVDHLVRGGAEERLTSVYAGYLQAAPGRKSRRQDETQALAMLGEHATRERVTRLLKSRPWTRRIDTGTWLVTAAGVAVLLAALAIFARAIGGAGPPTRIAFAVAPVEANPTLNPSPVIELQDDAGRRVWGAEDSVFVQVAEGPARLEGRTAERATQGRVTFDTLDLIRSDSIRESGTPVVVQFRARGMRPLEWSPTSLPRATLFLERGTLNQQTLAPPNPSAVIGAGDSIVADLHLRYTSPWTAAAVMLGGTPTWGDRRSSYFTLKPLVTPVADGHQRVVIRLAGPPHGRDAIT
ncbi:MAG TPA: AAA family ATPase [Gemmatimonadales bacterium]|nr:AAA family ATPase [Gemmatimonadales bacterium]